MCNKLFLLSQGFHEFVTLLHLFLESIIYIRDIKNNFPIFPIYTYLYYLGVTIYYLVYKSLAISNFPLLPLEV